MALDQYQLAELYRHAAARARAQGRAADTAEMAQWLRTSFDPMGTANETQLQVVARSAINTVRWAKEIDADPTRVPTYQQHKIDVGILPGDPRFAYRVVVRATNKDTGEHWETATTVQSPVALSPAQAMEAARNAFWANSLDRDYRARIAEMDNAIVPEAFLVSAGRRA